MLLLLVNPHRTVLANIQPYHSFRATSIMLKRNIFQTLQLEIIYLQAIIVSSSPLSILYLRPVPKIYISTHNKYVLKSAICTNIVAEYAYG